MASIIKNNNPQESQLTLNMDSSSDRKKELEEFENTKLGVKGLIDSGITRIPSMFHYPPEKLSALDKASLDVDDGDTLIPIIDMSKPQSEVVKMMRDAAAKSGFFKVINHGIPVSLLDRLLDGARAFHEEVPVEEKVRYYRRDIITTGTGCGFYSNADLFTSKAASWRDSFAVKLGPTPVNPSNIPDICRNVIIEWGEEVKQLGNRLMGLLCQGLGLRSDRLKGASYLGRVAMVGQYYPYCPEPNKTIGIAPHTDLGILTILVQDQVSGLQVKHDGKWFNMKPVHGAIVVNIGDLFQVLSNDSYISGKHRVLANSVERARSSVATFLGPGTNDDIYGPLDELISQEHPALYKQAKYSEVLTRSLTTEPTYNYVTNYFRL